MLEKLKSGMGSPRALAAYASLVKSVDHKMRRIHASHQDEMNCGPGCDRCCRTSRSVLAVEGFFMLMALRRIPSEPLEKLMNKAHAEPGACPLLDERGRCVIYDSRPLLCRTHGAPLLVDTGDETGVTMCDKNFTQRDLDAAFIPEEVFNTIGMNEKLVEVNKSFTNGHLPYHHRISVLDILKAALRGEDA